jgi:hypothetical protein
MRFLREYFFVRWLRKDCTQRLASEAARDLANIGHSKRRRTINQVAQQMRSELGLPEHPALKTTRA